MKQLRFAMLAIFTCISVTGAYTQTIEELKRKTGRVEKYCNGNQYAGDGHGAACQNMDSV